MCSRKVAIIFATKPALNGAIDLLLMNLLSLGVQVHTPLKWQTRGASGARKVCHRLQIFILFNGPCVAAERAEEAPPERGVSVAARACLDRGRWGRCPCAWRIACGGLELSCPLKNVCQCCQKVCGIPGLPMGARLARPAQPLRASQRAGPECLFRRA